MDGSNHLHSTALTKGHSSEKIDLQTLGVDFIALGKSEAKTLCSRFSHFLPRPLGILLRFCYMVELFILRVAVNVSSAKILSDYAFAL